MVCSMNSSARSLSIPVYDFSMSESVGPFCRLLLWPPDVSLGPVDLERLLFLSSLSLALLLPVQSLLVLSVLGVPLVEPGRWPVVGGQTGGGGVGGVEGGVQLHRRVEQVGLGVD